MKKLFNLLIHPLTPCFVHDLLFQSIQYSSGLNSSAQFAMKDCSPRSPTSPSALHTCGSSLHSSQKDPGLTSVYLLCFCLGRASCLEYPPGSSDGSHLSIQIQLHFPSFLHWEGIVSPCSDAFLFPSKANGLNVLLMNIPRKHLWEYSLIWYKSWLLFPKSRMGKDMKLGSHLPSRSKEKYSLGLQA